MKKIYCDFCGKECEESDIINFKYPKIQHVEIKSGNKVLGTLENGIKLEYVDCCIGCLTQLAKLIR